MASTLPSSSSLPSSLFPSTSTHSNNSSMNTNINPSDPRFKLRTKGQDMANQLLGWWQDNMAWFDGHVEEIEKDVLIRKKDGMKSKKKRNKDGGDNKGKGPASAFLKTPSRIRIQHEDSLPSSTARKALLNSNGRAFLFGGGGTAGSVGRIRNSISPSKGKGKGGGLSPFKENLLFGGGANASGGGSGKKISQSPFKSPLKKKKNDEKEREKYGVLKEEEQNKVASEFFQSPAMKARAKAKDKDNANKDGKGDDDDEEKKKVDKKGKGKDKSSLLVGEDPFSEAFGTAKGKEKGDDSGDKEMDDLGCDGMDKDKNKGNVDGNGEGVSASVVVVKGRPLESGSEDEAEEEEELRQQEISVRLAQAVDRHARDTIASLQDDDDQDQDGEEEVDLEGRKEAGEEEEMIDQAMVAEEEQEEEEDPQQMMIIEPLAKPPDLSAIGESDEDEMSRPGSPSPMPIPPRPPAPMMGQKPVEVEGDGDDVGSDVKDDGDEEEEGDGEDDLSTKTGEGGGGGRHSQQPLMEKERGDQEQGREPTTATTTTTTVSTSDSNNNNNDASSSFLLNSPSLKRPPFKPMSPSPNKKGFVKNDHHHRSPDQSVRSSPIHHHQHQHHDKDHHHNHDDNDDDVHSDGTEKDTQGAIELSDEEVQVQPKEVDNKDKDKNNVGDVVIVEKEIERDEDQDQDEMDMDVPLNDAPSKLRNHHGSSSASLGGSSSSATSDFRSSFSSSGPTTTATYSVFSDPHHTGGRTTAQTPGTTATDFSHHHPQSSLPATTTKQSFGGTGGLNNNAPTIFSSAAKSHFKPTSGSASTATTPYQKRDPTLPASPASTFFNKHVFKAGHFTGTGGAAGGGGGRGGKKLSETSISGGGAFGSGRLSNSQVVGSSQHSQSQHILTPPTDDEHHHHPNRSSQSHSQFHSQSQSQFQSQSQAVSAFFSQPTQSTAGAASYGLFSSQSQSTTISSMPESRPSTSAYIPLGSKRKSAELGLEEGDQPQPPASKFIRSTSLSLGPHGSQSQPQPQSQLKEIKDIKDMISSLRNEQESVPRLGGGIRRSSNNNNNNNRISTAPVAGTATAKVVQAPVPVTVQEAHVEIGQVAQPMKAEVGMEMDDDEEEAPNTAKTTEGFMESESIKHQQQQSATTTTTASTKAAPPKTVHRSSSVSNLVKAFEERSRSSSREGSVVSSSRAPSEELMNVGGKGKGKGIVNKVSPEVETHPQPKKEETGLHTPPQTKVFVRDFGSSQSQIKAVLRTTTPPCSPPKPSASDNGVDDDDDPTETVRPMTPEPAEMVPPSMIFKTLESAEKNPEIEEYENSSRYDDGDDDMDPVTEDAEDADVSVELDDDEDDDDEAVRASLQGRKRSASQAFNIPGGFHSDREASGASSAIQPSIPALDDSDPVEEIPASSSGAMGIFSQAASAIAKPFASSSSATATAATSQKKPVKSLQLAAAAAKKEREEKERKAALKEEREKQRLEERKRIEDERKVKAEETERRRKERDEQGGLSQSQSQSQPQPARPPTAMGKRGEAPEDEPAKKRKIEHEGYHTDTKKSGGNVPRQGKPIPTTIAQSASNPFAASSAPRFGQPIQPSQAPSAGLTSSTRIPQGMVAPQPVRPAGPSAIPTYSQSMSQQTSALPIPSSSKMKQPEPVHKPMPAPAPKLPSQNKPLPQPPKQDKRAQLRSEEPAFELPEIDSEYSDSDSEEHARKIARLPNWAQSPNLQMALDGQSDINPVHLFGRPAPLRLEEIFPKPRANFRLRSSSANWHTADGLTGEEEIDYARRMGQRLDPPS